MRIGVVVVLAAACNRADRAPEPPREPAAVTVDATVIAPDAGPPPPDAAPGALDTTAPASVPRLRYRSTQVGLIVRESRRFTAILTIDGDVVELAWARDTGKSRRIDGTEHTEPWVEQERGLLRGARDGDTLRLRDAAGAEVVLTCVEQSQLVQAAGAVIELGQGDEEECPGDWSWKPSKRSRVKLLHCSSTGSDDFDELRFGDPGIEDVYENSDCMVQDGGTRLMP